MPSIQVIRGWAQNASAEGMWVVPDLVRKSAHKDCADVDFHWQELLNLYEQRRELASHRLRPEDIMGVGATYEEVEAYIERSLDWNAGAIAWGDF